MSRWRRRRGRGKPRPFRYYEFRAVDRRLDERRMERLHGLSPFADVTPTGFVARCVDAELDEDPLALLDEMFDVFVYLSNRGGRRFAIRAPRSAVDLERASLYAGPCGSVELAANDEGVILQIGSPDLDRFSGWIHGEDWMPELAPLRDELLAGDYRGLYIGWLNDLQLGADDGTPEPPVPPGLREFDLPLDSLVEFLDVTAYLMRVGQERSAPLPQEPADPQQLAEWIASLPAAEKDDLLRRAALGDAPDPGGELLRRFRGSRAREAARTAAGSTWTVGRIRERVLELMQEDARREEQRRREAERQREAQIQAERERRFQDLIEREDEHWDRVGDLIAERKPDSYRLAVWRLEGLCEALTRVGRRDDFDIALRTIREENKRKTRLLEELNRAGLGEPRAG